MLYGSKLTDIFKIEGVPCRIMLHPTFNTSKVIIYLHDFDLDDVEQFERDLKQHYDIAEVVKATFIRTRNDQTTAFLLTFNNVNPPDTIYIPGERDDTGVYPYRAIPIMCKKCQNYGHTAKWCNNAVRCRKCSEENHSEPQCNNLGLVRCYHCNLQHKAGNWGRPKHIDETKITECQDKEKVSKLRATQIVSGFTAVHCMSIVTLLTSDAR